MEKIVEIFEDFINLTQTYEEFDLVELYSLKEKMQCLTPLLPLPLTDPNFSFLYVYHINFSHKYVDNI